MCGIIGECGVLSEKHSFMARLRGLRHRGPDGEGYFASSDGLTQLGHRRLAILDLSDRAQQPMVIGYCAIVYNGEVYNFRQIRERVGGPHVSESDTEVILRGYLKYGEDIFGFLEGMFAIGIYDMQQKLLILARDQMGIKPLYYYQTPSTFIFASEIQALGAPPVLNQVGLLDYLAQNYISPEKEIVQNVHSLPPGAVGCFNISANTFDLKSLRQQNPPLLITSEAAALTEVEKSLRASVQASLVSDVPVGVFLSSGVDSSLIAALARDVVTPLNTFTVAFDFGSFDESRHAAEIASILGTRHYTIELDKQTVLQHIPTILDHFHMPFGDSSAIPVYFLCRYARKYVKVCLSGDGADELFGGYPLYYLPSVACWYQWLPGHQFLRGLAGLLPTSFGRLGFDEKLRRFLGGVGPDYRLAHFAYRMMRHEHIIKPEYRRPLNFFSELFAPLAGQSIGEQLMRVDQQTILPQDYLVKVDRMSMAHGLEVRVPFLNQSIVELSRQLDLSLKIRGWTTKYILKQLLTQYLPSRLVYRKKQGFSFPIAHWLCRELREFMLATLSRDQVAKIALLEYTEIERMIKDHLARRHDYGRELWGLLSLVRYVNQLS